MAKMPRVGDPVELIVINRHAAKVTEVAAFEGKTLLTVRTTNSPGHDKYRYQFLKAEKGWSYVHIRDGKAQVNTSAELRIL